MVVLVNDKNEERMLKTKEARMAIHHPQYKSMIFKSFFLYLSRRTRKPKIYIYENKGADQLRGSREADKHICFLYTDGTTPLLSKSKFSRL